VLDGGKAMLAMVDELVSQFVARTLFSAFKRNELRSRRLLARLGFAPRSVDDSQRVELVDDEGQTLRPAHVEPASV
jgi:hypothetical protein